MEKGATAFAGLRGPAPEINQTHSFKIHFYFTYTSSQLNEYPELPIVDLNIGSGARFAAGLQELHAISIIQGTSTCASSPLF